MAIVLTGAVRCSVISIMCCVIRPGCQFRLPTIRYLVLHSERDAVLRK